MYISKIILSNWRNFRKVEANLKQRIFIVGPNASGKSNFLDVFRFLRDVARDGGGLQEAVVKLRGGVSKIRCLSARAQSDIEIEAWLSDDATDKIQWRYKIAFTQTGGGVFDARPKLRSEQVWNDAGKLVCNRPTDKDQKDERLLEYTWLEQATSNGDFREVADFFAAIQYLHIVPQLLRDSKSFIATSGQDDFYGRNFIEQINRTNKKVRDSFLKRIESSLQIAVPQFSKLELVKDSDGIPHLQAMYQHWRAAGAKQWENQFSDGTLRLIGFLWAMLDGNKPLLLEEPELSLHSEIVSQLAGIIAKLQRKKSGQQRQVILTTHSYELLSDKGIAPEEVLLLKPSAEGTVVESLHDNEEIITLLRGGLTMAQVVQPETKPEKIDQLSLQL